MPPSKLQQSACSLCTTVREAPKESPNVTCIANASEMVPAMYRWDAGIYDAEVLTMSCKLINTRINLTMLTGVQITLIKAVKKKLHPERHRKDSKAKVLITVLGKEPETMLCMSSTLAFIDSFEIMECVSLH